MMKLKIVSTFALLALFVALAACGKDNTAGTDEQANSVTALDSALAEWLVTDTLVAPEPQPGRKGEERDAVQKCRHRFRIARLRNRF